MPDERGVTHYDLMPIPPVDEQMQLFHAGIIMIGVEYRLLDDAIAAASVKSNALGEDLGPNTFGIDRGVSLHVFANSEDGEALEYLRFDCFDEDPHYHYISWSERTNQMIHIDPVASGDPLDWALRCIRHQLRPMLERAGAAKSASHFEAAQVEAILPRVAEAAYRARFNYDEKSIRAAALGKSHE